MQFIVSTSALLKQLQTISGVIAANTVLPILESFLFDIKKGGLTISSSDMETSMTTEMAIEANENIRVAVPAKQLIDILKNLSEQPLAVKVDNDTFNIEISSENGKYKLMGEDGNNYPKIPQAEGAEVMKAASKILHRAISKTLFAVGSDDLRPAMNGVYFQISPEGTNFVATDAHRLVKFNRTDLKFESSSSFIVPRKSLSQLRSMLSNDETEVSISYDKNNAFFVTDKVQLVCRLIDAKYPDYQAVIPADNPSCLTINKEDLLGALRRVQIFSNKTTNQVAFKIAGSSLHISGQDLDFSNEANETLTCQYNGDDLEIGFNSKFLIEMLVSVDTETIKLELSTSSRAGILMPDNQEENEQIIILVMPIMLNSNY
jgi:DNA polymerase III subunit beta